MTSRRLIAGLRVVATLVVLLASALAGGGRRALVLIALLSVPILIGRWLLGATAFRIVGLASALARRGRRILVLIVLLPAPVRIGRRLLRASVASLLRVAVALARGRRLISATSNIDIERGDGLAIDSSGGLETLLSLKSDQCLPRARTKSSVRLAAYIEAHSNQRHLHFTNLLHAQIVERDDLAATATAQLGARRPRLHYGDDPPAVIHDHDVVVYNEIHVTSEFGVNFDECRVNRNNPNVSWDHGSDIYREVDVSNTRRIAALDHPLSDSRALIRRQVYVDAGIAPLRPFAVTLTLPALLALALSSRPLLPLLALVALALLAFLALTLTSRALLPLPALVALALLVLAFFTLFLTGGLLAFVVATLIPLAPLAVAFFALALAGGLLALVIVALILLTLLPALLTLTLFARSLFAPALTRGLLPLALTGVLLALFALALPLLALFPLDLTLFPLALRRPATILWRLGSASWRFLPLGCAAGLVIRNVLG